MSVGPKLALLCVLQPIACLAGVTFVKHPNHPAPLYFSGTNARAFFSAQVDGGTQHISEALFSIGGQTVYSETFPISGTAPHFIYNSEVQHAEMFDSTVFPHGQFVQIKLKVKADGVWYQDSYAAVAKNSVAVFENPDTFDFAGEVLDNVFGQANIAVSGVFDQTSWTNDDYFLGLAGKNHSFIFSHGNNVSIRSGVTSPEPMVEITAERFFDEMCNIVGSGDLPPYNATGLPPLNFLAFHSCRTGQNSDYQDSLFPNFNAFQWFYAENQCFWAYKVQLPINSFAGYATALSDHLLQGYAADFCRQALCDEDVSIPHNLKVRDCNQNGVLCESACPNHPWHYIEASDIVILGDQNAKIKTVYTGDSALNSSWFRAIDMPGGY